MDYALLGVLILAGLISAYIVASVVAGALT